MIEGNRIRERQLKLHEQGKVSTPGAARLDLEIEKLQQTMSDLKDHIYESQIQLGFVEHQLVRKYHEQVKTNAQPDARNACNGMSTDVPEADVVADMLEALRGCDAAFERMGFEPTSIARERICAAIARADLARPRVKALVDASENLIIAIGMGWDLDGCIENVQATRAALKGETP